MYLDTSKKGLNSNSFILMLILLASIFFNNSNPYLRILILSIWAFLPLFHLIVLNKFSLSKNEMLLLLFGLFWVMVFLISILKNHDTFSLNVMMANVESYTPFLFLFQTIFFIYFNKIRIQNIENFLFYFFFFVSLIFVLDVVYRYFLEPECFMNYWCRTQAKKIGIFSTTNVSGMLLGFLIISSTYLKFSYKNFFASILFVVLVTTLARAAIISTMIVLVLRYINLDRPISSIFLLSLIFSTISIYLFYDPLNLLSDGSLLSKFDFFTASIEVIKNSNTFDLIFGFGSSFEYMAVLLGVSGWSAHAPILKSLLYYGILGVIFFFLYIAQIFFAEKKMFLPILFFLICGLAGAPIFWPSLFTGYVLIFLSQELIKNKKIIS